MIIQPGHQRQVVSQAPEQGHGGVAVQVDQPGQDNMLVQVEGFPGAITLVCLSLRHDRQNSAALKDYGLVFKDNPEGFDGNQPAGIDSGIGCGDGFCRH
jgi:hypothetical protein